MDDKEFTLVPMIIPCRNEGKYIAKCLDSIITRRVILRISLR